jgi:uncharacterized SAM-binding protein YcdF (DUF218 family)
MTLTRHTVETQGTAHGLRRRVAFLVAAAVLGTALVWLLADAPAEFLVRHDRFETVDAALVMAGDPGYERTTTAAALVLHGRARLLILTGGEPGPGDSAESLRDQALKLGVPEIQIRTESLSHDTWSSMQAVQPILSAEGVRTLALVTSPYHQRRAFLAAGRVFGSGVTVFNHPAEPSHWSPHGWWRSRRGRRIVLSEYAKLVYYGFRGWGGLP